jgi:hypothetical protein
MAEAATGVAAEIWRVQAPVNSSAAVARTIMGKRIIFFIIQFPFL